MKNYKIYTRNIFVVIYFEHFSNIITLYEESTTAMKLRNPSDSEKEMGS